MKAVTLTKDECWHGVMLGVRRRIELVDWGGISNIFGIPDADNWRTDVEGACAEVAVAKLLNKFWCGGVGTFKNPDVGNYQVRWTHREDGCLIVRPTDADHEYFILVTGTIPNYKVIGWIKGALAKKEIWKRGPNGRPAAYFVPQSALTQWHQ